MQATLISLHILTFVLTFEAPTQLQPDKHMQSAEAIHHSAPARQVTTWYTARTAGMNAHCGLPTKQQTKQNTYKILYKSSPISTSNCFLNPTSEVFSTACTDIYPSLLSFLFFFFYRSGKSKYSNSPDDSLFRHIASVYATNHLFMSKNTPCVGDYFKGGVTNGAEWYNVPGELSRFRRLNVMPNLD